MSKKSFIAALAAFLATITLHNVSQEVIIAKALPIEENIHIESPMTKNFETIEEKENRLKKEEEDRLLKEERARVEEEKIKTEEEEKKRREFILSRGGNPDFKGSLKERALEQAKTKIGSLYVWGAEGPNTFDCSGLVKWSYKLQGKDIPRTTWEQVDFAEKINKKNLEVGDLLFFNMHGKNDHVGIYVGNNKMLHAPKPGDVVKIANVPWSKLETIRRIN